MAPRGESPRAVSAFPLLRIAASPSHRRNSVRGEPVAEKAMEVRMEMEREVLRCQVCGLVQYRTRTDNCRRCVRTLPARVTFVIPTPPPEAPGIDAQEI